VQIVAVDGAVATRLMDLCLSLSQGAPTVIGGVCGSLRTRFDALRRLSHAGV